MSETKKKAAKKKITPVAEVIYACTVTSQGTKIGAMICGVGAKARLPEAKAKALEKLGKIRIDGVL